MSAAIDPMPVSPDALAETKAYLRLEDDGEDALLTRLLGAATAQAARAVAETVPADGAWRRLTLTPVTVIGGIDGRPVSGDPFALPIDAYAIDIDAAGDGWVRVTGPGSATRATVRYTAGLAVAWTGLPEPIRQGIVRLGAHLYSHRDAADEAGPPAAVAALWRPWRRMRLR